MENNRTAGYRIIEFSKAGKEALWEIAECLLPYEQQILDEWVDRQCKSWEPPNLSRDGLREVFGALLRDILSCMARRQLEICIDDLEVAGAQLAARQFPFEALVVSVHFLEESYMPYLLKHSATHNQNLLLAMDEFLHAAIAAIATSYFEAYRKTLLDQAEVGRVVQESLLANIPRKSADLEIYHVYQSAHISARLGGDFLDCFLLDDGSLVFLLGDLAGHGLEAAADSIMLRSLFRGFMRENPDLVDAMGRLNRVLMSELKSSLFATAVAIAYEEPGKLKIVSAGHPYPVICNSDAGLFKLSGIALAIQRSSAFVATDTILSPGGVLVAYTDGLIESKNEQRQMFGEEKVVEIVSQMRNASARAITDTLIDESLRFAGGKFVDDVAILVIKRKA